MIFLVIMGLCACAEQGKEEDTDNFTDCLYEAPKPIFSDRLPAVQQHRFKIRSAKGIEQLVFDTGLELAIHQSGCELMQQNFYFKVESGVRLENAEACIIQASEYFYFLGSLDEALLPLYEWGRMIEKHANSMSLDTPFEVYPGFAVTVKQYKKRKAVFLEVILAQVEEV
ncbi:MAG: hypothetical protein AAF849_11440 [Bacteroidota bacterium]